MTDTTNAANSPPITAECAANTKTPKRLLGWRTSDYLMETSDREMAQNWQVHHEMLPIFEGDPHTKLAAPQPQGGVRDWRDQLETLIDIYDDGVNNPPESRAYVDGAFRQQIEEARAILTQSTPLAPQQAGDGLRRDQETAYNSIDRFLRNNLCDEDYAQYSAELDALLSAPRQPAAASWPKLKVFYGAMPESNGKSNFTAILYREGSGEILGGIENGITLDRSEYPDRVRYEADRARFLIGELETEPFILDYDADKHSGYVEQNNEPRCDVCGAKTTDPWLDHRGCQQLASAQCA